MKALLILLTILKILGIIIASIIALLLVVIAVVLFVPVRYKGRAGLDGTPDAEIRAGWLFNIVGIKFDLHNKESSLAIKIFGHTLGKNAKKRNKKEKKKKNEKKGHNKDKKNIPDAEESTAKSPVNGHSGDEPSYKNSESADAGKDYEYGFPEDDSYNSENNNKKGIFKNIKDKYNNISGKIADVSAQVKDESNKRALKAVLTAALKALKHIKPGKHDIIIKFGMDDPALTGELLGIIYAAAIIAELNIAVTPDFENKVFEIYGSFKGRIRIFKLGIIALRTYRNKDFKNALHKFT